MKTMRQAIALAAGLSAMVMVDARGEIRVLLLGDNSTAGTIEDVRSKIQATGRVDAVYDVFNNDGDGTPTLAALQNYDVVVVWTDSGLDDGVGLGNVLADYVDAGGAVVEATFGIFDLGGIGIQGRWKTGQYATMTATSQLTGAATLGARLVSSHPILDGVASFSGGSSSYRNAATLTPGSYRIANWSDGQPLVATNHAHAGKVAGLNFYPPSSTMRADFWDAATDGGVLLANAINFVSNNSVDVLLCVSPFQATWADEVRDRLLEGGRVGGRIDVFNISAGTPPTAALMQYDSVLVATDLPSQNPTLLGNNLADYVDAGGGVTVTTFALSFGVDGRFLSGGYSPLNQGGQSQGTPLTLGARLIPDHPLLAGVASFSGGSSSYHGNGGLRAGAVRVADWSNGAPLLAATVGKKGRVAGVNFYPPSSVSRADFWDRTTDGAAMLSNALTWAARNDNDVLVLGDDGVAGTLDDIRAKLSPLVNGSVHTYDYRGPIPGIARLRKYDSVLVYANLPSSDPNALGDRLAAFVDGGGGVVDMYATASDIWAIGGRWSSGGYSGMLTGDIAFGGHLTMSAKLFPLHPALNQVARVDTGTAGFHNTGGVRPGSLRLADLSNGAPLAIERSTGSGRVMTLNFFPGSRDVVNGSWDTTSDAGRLIANSLNHAARSDIDALVVATESVGSANFRDVVARIKRTGRIRGLINSFNNNPANPPVGLLAAYDSVLVWSNFGQPDFNEWGNRLAFYANLGGGVVTASGAHHGATFGVGGQWLARPYTPASFGAGTLTTPGASLAARHRPEHPVLAGVNAFAFGSIGLHDFLTTSAVGERIADLSNGRPLVAEAKAPGARQTIALNMFPMTTDANGAGWNPATRGGLLMANALTYVSAERPCLFDFNGDGFIDFFDYDDYVNCFESGVCPPGRDADINGDGFVDFFDYDAFVAGFEIGC